MDTYSSLEARIAELHEYEDTISKNLESIQKTDLIIKSIDSRIAAFKNNTERSDKRVQKLIEYLQSIEENTLILKSREQEIKDVKDKFNELDGLTRHIEKRIDQIHAMFQKTESMREEIDDTDDRLKRMFDETDKKIKQFADILHSVEENNLISRQIKADYNLGKNINEGMIKAVRELSNKGWTSDEISQKLLIDENSVRFIINTSSL
jgi:chromosome segregation ATPase